MDEENLQQTRPDERFLPPRLSRISTILNGMGNGAMIGVLPIAAWELITKFKDKNSSRTAIYATAFATVVGCGLGAMHGNREAREIDQYRRNVSNELGKSGDKIAELRAQLDAMAAAKGTGRA